MTDISEAYRSVETGPITNSCRRFCWFTNPDDPGSLQDYHLTVCNYGDRPAGNILAQSLDIVASDPQTPPVVSEFISKNLYVDCLLYTSPSPRDVEESRMPSSA